MHAHDCHILRQCMNAASPKKRPGRPTLVIRHIFSADLELQGVHWAGVLKAAPFLAQKAVRARTRFRNANPAQRELAYRAPCVKWASALKAGPFLAQKAVRARTRFQNENPTPRCDGSCERGSVEQEPNYAGGCGRVGAARRNPNECLEVGVSGDGRCEGDGQPRNVSPGSVTERRDASGLLDVGDDRDPILQVSEVGIQIIGRQLTFQPRPLLPLLSTSRLQGAPNG
jgi:hypothetical protein